MGKNKYIDLFDDMMPAIDLGIKELWDASDENGQKDIKGDLWNLNRYVSSVKGSRDIQFLMKLYPDKKLDEVELIARISTKEEIKQLAKEHGYEKIDI